VKRKTEGPDPLGGSRAKNDDDNNNNHNNNNVLSVCKEHFDIIVIIN
jgi:hypothetical protein